MKKSKLYHAAAELVGTEHDEYIGLEYSCICIEVAGNYRGSVFDARAEYEKLFEPPLELNPLGYHGWGNLWGNTHEERINCRILALLFMGEIAKDEEAKK